MTERQKLTALRSLRDELMTVAMRRWRDESWTVKVHLECDAGRHRRVCLLAWLDEDENIVHVLPHPVEKNQPVARTMLHELVHIMFDLEGGRWEERVCEAVEAALWPVLTPAQRKQLANLVPL